MENEQQPNLSLKKEISKVIEPYLSKIKKLELENRKLLASNAKLQKRLESCEPKTKKTKDVVEV